MCLALSVSNNPASRQISFIKVEHFLTVLKIIFNFVLAPPLPGGVPGEGPDCHVPKEIGGVWPTSARSRGAILFLILILALSAAGTCAALVRYG